MTVYNFKIIQKFADRLYARAKMSEIIYTIIGIMFGFVGGYNLGEELGYGLFGAVILGLLGFWVGSERAFMMRLQAQMALCQAKIEENTR